MYEKLKDLIAASENIVFFGGAGVSTESGIPDFRGDGGLYTRDDGTVMPPEEILSHECLTEEPKIFYDYYKKCMIYPDARPNKAHLALAKLEKIGKLKAVITQNIDGLHQMAGSEKVIELHGSILENYCVNCGKTYDLPFILASKGVPICTECGGLVRPDVVMYGEGLDMQALTYAANAIARADVLIVAGTSLTVNPAASLVRYYRGDHLVIINRTPTSYDRYAEMLIRDPVGEVLGSII